MYKRSLAGKVGSRLTKSNGWFAYKDDGRGGAKIGRQDEEERDRQDMMAMRMKDELGGRGTRCDDIRTLRSGSARS